MDLISTLRRAAATIGRSTEWRGAEPAIATDFATDRRLFGEFWRLSDELVAHLPPKPQRNAEQAKAAAFVHARARGARRRFLDAHVRELYAGLTHNLSRFVRVEELVYAAVELCPGLTPSREQVEEEDALLQRDKDGCEIDQGILLVARART